MSARPDHRFLIVADGQFGPLTSKTANSCIRYFPERIVGVLDRDHAGKTVQDVLGFGGAIPVVGDFERGLALGAGGDGGTATAVLIGIAPMGGRLPDEWRAWLRMALERGLEVWNGLHTFLADQGLAARISASVGIASYPDHALTPEGLIQKADQAMYRVKEKDKNGIEVAV